MKNLNKVLAMLVVFMMMVSSVAFASSFSDVADTSSYSTAIETGVDLGLFNGYEDGTFAPEGEITRAEFAAIVVRLKGQEAQAAGAKSATMFTDVPADHWAAGYVNIAVQAGVINGYGNGMFGPEDLVEYQDAITMIVRALGYEPAIGAAGYPTGYLTKAGELGLTTGVNGVNGVAINRGAVAQIAFNALDVPLMTQSGFGTFTQYVINDGYSSTNGTNNVKKTLLSENHSTVKIQGIVLDSTDSSATSVNTTDKVYVKVTNYLYNKFGINGNNVPMEVGASDAMNFVGKKCIMFVEYDEFEDVCTIKSLYEVPSVDTLVIDFDDIDSVTYANGKAEIKYYASETKTATVTVTLAGMAAPFYNGVAGASNAPSTDVNYTALKNSIGTLELALLDATNTTTDYDTVYVTEYNTFIVDSVKASASRVSAKDGSFTSRINYNEEDGDVRATLLDANGVAMDWADLQEYDVLMVKYTTISGGKTIYEAQIIENTVEGIVTSKSGSALAGDLEIVINGEAYEVASAVTSTINVGDEGVYYLDSANKVVYVDATSTKSDNYGYVISVDTTPTGLSTTYQAKILTKDNTIAIYDFAKKIRYNGGANADVTTLTASINGLAGQLITFKTNSSEQISRVDTAIAPSSVPTGEDPEDYFVKNNSGLTLEFSADDNSLRGATRRMYMTDSTVIFSIDGEDSEIVSLAMLADEDDLYGADIYDLDDDDNIAAIVIPATSNSNLTGGSEFATFITKVGTTANEEGDLVTYITGYAGLDEVTYTSEDVATTDVTVGKMYIPKYNANGTVKSFTQILTGATGLGTDKTAVSGTLTAMDTRRGYITVGATQYKIKSTTNVYVYNTLSNARVKYTVDAGMDYIDWDDVYNRFFIDEDTFGFNVDVQMFLDDGDVVDLVYYIY